mmetsp:Transcript_40082/g.96770  ORF Transcript_40082/g.96770 Transcript_40082/m.96770 type:complete len:128 (+) Transcript_40082:331-714(+)
MGGNGGTCNANANNALNRFAEEGKYSSRVQELLKRGADTSGRNRRGSTPLEQSCEKGHLEIVKLLFEKGADVHVESSNGETPSDLASSCNGHLEVVKLLLEQGADVRTKTNTGMTPLHDACKMVIWM